MSNEIRVESIDADLVIAQTDDVNVIAAKSEKIVIANQEQYEFASDTLKQIKARAKELDTQRKEITIPLDEAKKKVMDLFRNPLDLLAKAESYVKKLMLDYVSEQERIAAEKQRELQRLADIERKKLDAKIERAKASGKDEKAEELEIQKESIQVITPIVAPTIETPKGVSFSMKYRAVVEDFSKLPDEYKLPNQTALDKIAQATKGTISIPGVKIESEKILSSRK